MGENMALYRLAQGVTDKVLGEGTYKKMNHFDPSKGETHGTKPLKLYLQEQRERAEKGMKIVKSKLKSSKKRKVRAMKKEEEYTCRAVLLFVVDATTPKGALLEARRMIQAAVDKSAIVRVSVRKKKS